MVADLRMLHLDYLPAVGEVVAAAVVAAAEVVAAVVVVVEDPAAREELVDQALLALRFCVYSISLTAHIKCSFAAAP